MQIRLRRKGSIAILDIDGKVIGSNALVLKDVIHQQIHGLDSEVAPRKNRKKLNIILNMKQVQMIDSFGLGILVAFYTSIRRNQGNMVLLNLEGKVKDLIVMAKLMIIFDCYNTEREAIAGIIGVV